MLRARSRRNVVSLLCLIGIAIQSFGCMTISEKFLDQEYYLIEPSAVIPEFMRIFGADERAKAYDEGVHLIEEAEGNYLLAHATGTNNSGIISPNVLTREGAQLYVQVVASVKLVEQLLVAQLPKV